MLAVALKIVIAGVCAGAIDILRKDEVVDVEGKWTKLMVSCGIKAKGDDSATYFVVKSIKRVYGHDLIVGIPDGMTYSGLEALEEQIKICYKCFDIHMEYKDKSGTGFIRLITEPLSEKTVFQPVEVKPWEVYLGTTKYYKDIIVDMRTYTHGIITGVTGAGKSIFTIETILNMVVNHTEGEINIFLAEISDKDDFKLFRNCTQVKEYARTLPQLAKTLNYLYDEMGRRNRLFNEFDDITDLYGYNKKFAHNPLPWIYFFTDEYSLIMEDESDTDQEEFYKKQCQAYMKKLAKLARNSGIFIFSSLQRPDKESMPPIFKTNLNVSIAFKQKNTASALTALDSTKPMELKYREAIVDYGGNQYIIYSLYLTTFIIKCYLESCVEDEHKFESLSLYDWLDKEAKKYKKDKKKGKKQQDVLPNELETAPTSIAPNLDNVVSIETPKKKSRSKKKGEF